MPENGKVILDGSARRIVIHHHRVAGEPAATNFSMTTVAPTLIAAPHRIPHTTETRRNGR